MATTTQIIAAAANISQVVLVLGLYLGWRQLSVAIKDIQLRSKREAGMIAIEEAEKFAEEIIPSFDEINSKISGSGAPNRLERFVISEIHPVNLQKYKDRREQMKKNPDVHGNLFDLANKIEGIATAFMKGIADEEVIFEAVGPVYCEIVEHIYFFYCHGRGNDDKNLGKILSYSNTIKLYCIWKERIGKLGLEANKRDLVKKTTDIDKEIQVASIKSTPVKPLGTF